MAPKKLTFYYYFLLLHKIDIIESSQLHNKTYSLQRCSHSLHI